MADSAGGRTDGQASGRFLTVQSNGNIYAIPAADVAEVIHIPAVARVPQAPKSLLGIANLRGVALPLVSLRGLLGRDEAGGLPMARAVVLDGVAPVALAVDAVDALLTIDPAQIETRQLALAGEPGERLQGIFKPAPNVGAIKVLDLRGLLSDAFAQRPAQERRTRNTVVPAATLQTVEQSGHLRMVTFDVGDQEFALGLDGVVAIVPASENRIRVPHSDSAVIGLTGYRDTVLPLFSLRRLLGLAGKDEAGGWEKVIVAVVHDVLVGLVADRMRAIITANPALVEPIPAVLAARTGGEARIKAIYRGDAGQRLISILAPEQLFREEVLRQLSAQSELSHEFAEGDRDSGPERKFLVFRLGGDEFALPIEAVDEVAPVPDRITRVPRTPKFLEGVVNFRGGVLPIIDQRRRFGMPQLADGEGRRLVVVRTERHRAGLIVDSVSEVLGSPPDAIEPAPNMASEKTQLVRGVINLEKARRIVLELDPSELLSRAERALLDTFEAKAGQALL